MNKQIRYALWTFLFIFAFIGLHPGFTVLVDAQQTEISEVNPSGANKQIDEKPVYRCPKKQFLLRMGCRKVKPVGQEAETGGEKSFPKKENVDNDLNSPLLISPYEPISNVLIN